MIILAQITMPVILAFCFALITIFGLRMRVRKQVNLMALNPNFENHADAAIMLICPFVAFLFAEALSLSGYIVLITLVFLLKLYAKPNIQSEKIEFLNVCLVSISHLFKQVAFILMGLSLPLHVG